MRGSEQPSRGYRQSRRCFALLVRRAWSVNGGQAWSYMRGAEDGAVPVAHEQILGVLQAVTAGLSAETLLTLLELLEQAEVARNLGGHGCELPRRMGVDGSSFFLRKRKRNMLEVSKRPRENLAADTSWEGKNDGNAQGQRVGKSCRWSWAGNGGGGVDVCLRRGDLTQLLDVPVPTAGHFSLPPSAVLCA